MELGGRKSQSQKAVLPQDGLDPTHPLTQLHRKRRQPISIADTVSVENLVGDLVPGEDSIFLRTKLITIPKMLCGFS